ncbi:MAG: putative glycoside hydrolase family 15 protein, partial [Lachnospiraceae bacterium]|nr:putative glycoside hydrolase family 15 protein [Lachnospiraceae bacterium]
MSDLWNRKDAPKIAMIYGHNPRWDSSKAEILEAAKYDLIIAGFDIDDTPKHIAKLNDNLKRLHELNDRLIVVSYIAGSCEYFPKSKYFDNDCFLKTTEGDMINSWPGSCMLNLSKEKTIQSYMNLIEDKWPSMLEVDGVYIDCMCGSFDAWAVELESKKKVKIDADEDGKEDSKDVLDKLWVKGKETILKETRKRYGDKPYILVNGSMEADYARPYADGTIFEGVLDHINLPENYTKYSFDDIMSQYIPWGKSGTGKPNCTYIDVTPGFDVEFNHPVTRPAEESCRYLERGYSNLKHMRFGLATALLGDGHYTYQMHTKWLGNHWWYHEYDIPIGKPLGAYYKSQEDDTYKRDYENAIVAVNMTYHDTIVHFDHTMRDETTG